jgi:hypothetical protein
VEAAGVGEAEVEVEGSGSGWRVHWSKIPFSVGRKLRAGPPGLVCPREGVGLGDAAGGEGGEGGEGEVVHSGWESMRKGGICSQ